MTIASATDFSTDIIGDLGRAVTYYVVTKTKDAMTGEETTTFASSVSKTVVFFVRDTRFTWDKEGLLDGADAYIMATPAEAIKRYDKFTIDSVTYYIDAVIKRYVGTTEMVHFGKCFKTE